MSNRELSRVAFKIMYDGTNYSGWQIQNNSKSIQGIIQEALVKLTYNIEVKLIGAGRTDTGVHAEMQVAHADIYKRFDNHILKEKLNSLLPNSIYISDVVDVSNDFHSRFSAINRGYKYKISLIKNPFLNRYRYFLFKDFNPEILNLCANKIIGKKDFTFFSKNNPDTLNSICDVTKSDWEIGKDYLEYNIEANRFLYGMVRLILGFQIDCATGKRVHSEFDELINKKERSNQSMMIKPNGLFLTKIEYQQFSF
ncbi:MAG: tRNA pseudouridine(38-40) synthase TruA [Chlorobi bacterium]|nr:tRNA pseudouridine(38-40) synthase TruA [Chlorobiota bacterium]